MGLYEWLYLKVFEYVEKGESLNKMGIYELNG